MTNSPPADAHDRLYLEAAGWRLWTYGNPDLARDDPGVWADPQSMDASRRLRLARAVAEQRDRDAGTLF